MRTYIGKYLNREHETHILNLIGDYCSSFRDWRNYAYKKNHESYQFYRLRFYVTKRKHLGQIYVETIVHRNELYPYMGVAGPAWLHGPRPGPTSRPSVAEYVNGRKYLKANMWRRMGDFSITAAACPLKIVLRNLKNTLVDTTNLQNMIRICEDYAADYGMVVPR
jgi:hypothetical protein